MYGMPANGAGAPAYGSTNGNGNSNGSSNGNGNGNAAVPSRPQTLGNDPFAGLPRLSRFADVDESGPAQPSPAAMAEPPSWPPRAVQPAAPVNPQPAAPAPWSSPAPNGSELTSGRRHAAVEDEVVADEPPAGGRRRRADGETNDILARLLGPS
jgi:hypothetical protein